MVVQMKQQQTNIETVDLRLALIDSPIGDIPVRISCPKHPDPNPSCCVYHDHVYCYSVGCGFKIFKRMEALAWLLELPSWRDALRVAGKYTNEGIEAYRERAERKARANPIPPSTAALYHKMLYKTRSKGYTPVQWYYERGLSDATIERFHLGHDGTRFTIPIYSRDGELLNIRFRVDETYTTEDDYAGGKLQKKYSGVGGRNGAYLYPEWLIDPEIEYMILCEGELDAVLLHQEGYPALTTTNGAGNLPKVLQSLKNYASLKRLYICTDMDDAGDFIAEQLGREAAKLGYSTKRLVWDKSYKDVTALYQAGLSLKDTQRVFLRP